MELHMARAATDYRAARRARAKAKKLVWRTLSTKQMPRDKYGNRIGFDKANPHFVRVPA